MAESGESSCRCAARPPLRASASPRKRRGRQPRVPARPTRAIASSPLRSSGKSASRSGCDRQPGLQLAPVCSRAAARRVAVGRHLKEQRRLRPSHERCGRPAQTVSPSPSGATRSLRPMPAEPELVAAFLTPEAFREFRQSGPSLPLRSPPRTALKTSPTPRAHRKAPTRGPPQIARNFIKAGGLMRTNGSSFPGKRGYARSSTGSRSAGAYGLH
jgi:hypothetical protein